MRMKVLIFEPCSLWTPHFQTSLELAERHLQEGDEVAMLECRASVPACYANPAHRHTDCLFCMDRRAQGLGLLSRKITCERFDCLTDSDHQKIESLPSGFPDLEAVKAFSIGRLDIGYAALSSLVSILRNPQPDLREHGELLSNLMRACYTSYLSMQHQLQKHRPDRVYMFNGRYALLRGAFRACREAGIDCFLHERGSHLTRYALFENRLPHDISNIHRRIQTTWESTPAPDREKLAARFYEARANGRILSWHSFVDQQEQGSLPPDWDDNRNNIVIFNSSEDEFAAIGDEHRNPLYPDQAQGISAIARDLSDSENCRLYLRMHPNLAGIENDSVRALFELPTDLIQVIPPDSRISSYTLMQRAAKIITFGSTTGIEAAYWGRPSILAGRSFYEDLGSVYRPESHADLIELAHQPLAPLPRLGAIQFGLYMYTFGEEFRYFQPDSICGGTFKGERIRGTRWLRKSISLEKRLPRLSRFLVSRTYKRMTR